MKLNKRVVIIFLIFYLIIGIFSAPMLNLLDGNMDPIKGYIGDLTKQFTQPLMYLGILFWPLIIIIAGLFTGPFVVIFVLICFAIIWGIYKFSFFIDNKLFKKYSKNSHNGVFE